MIRARYRTRLRMDSVQRMLREERNAERDLDRTRYNTASWRRAFERWSTAMRRTVQWMSDRTDWNDAGVYTGDRPGEAPW